MTDPLSAFTAPGNDPFEGLPAWMIEERPHTATVEVTQVLRRGRVIEPGFEAPSVVTPRPNGDLECTWRFHEQLSRDGKELTLKDRLPTLRAGERDGWLKRKC